MDPADAAGVDLPFPHYRCPICGKELPLSDARMVVTCADHSPRGDSRPFTVRDATNADRRDTLRYSADVSGFVRRDTLAPVMRRRRGRPIFLIDIAVPRDVEPEVASLDNVFLYDVDDLEEVVADMARERAAEADQVEGIVAEEASRFLSWWRALDAVE